MQRMPKLRNKMPKNHRFKEREECKKVTKRKKNEEGKE